MCNLMSWPGVGPGPPVLGTRSFSYWSAREVPLVFFMVIDFPSTLAAKPDSRPGIKPRWMGHASVPVWFWPLSLHALLQTCQTFTSCSIFFFLPCRESCRILLPWPGIEPTPSAVEVQTQPLDRQGSPVLQHILLFLFLPSCLCMCHFLCFSAFPPPNSNSYSAFTSSLGLHGDQTSPS